MIYTAPTVVSDKRTLMATYDDWKEITPRVDPNLARRIDQQLTRHRRQPLIRVELSIKEAATVLALAQG